MNQLRLAAEPRYVPVSSPFEHAGDGFCLDLALDLRAMV